MIELTENFQLHGGRHLDLFRVDSAPTRVVGVWRPNKQQFRYIFLGPR